MVDSVKTINGVAVASIKTLQGVAKASLKSWNGVTLESDPYFSSVSMLLHCDGADTSTTITDSSSYARSMTAVANAQISTAQSKFGGASLLVDGTGDWVTTPNATELNPGAGDWTIEFFARLNASASGANDVCGKGGVGTGDPVFVIGLAPTNNMYYYISSNSTSWDIASDKSYGTITINTETWYHIALVKSGTTITPYVDGVAGTGTSTMASGSCTSTAIMYVGSSNYGPDAFYGNIDEFRFTKGVARYTGNFTPPIRAFPNQ